jgi:hypothetical protein
LQKARRAHSLKAALPQGQSVAMSEAYWKKFELEPGKPRFVAEERDTEF